MEIQKKVHYSQDLENNEIEILRKFEATIIANWGIHSNYNLEWTLFNDDAEPKRYAILSVRNNHNQLIKESLWSLGRKRIVEFEKEFIVNAKCYSDSRDNFF